MSYTAVVLGASGFAGGELLRLLSRHPDLEVVAAAADRRAGDPVGEVHPNQASRSSRFAPTSEVVEEAADLCFSALPLGELPRILPSIKASAIVDISGDHREPESGWVYGLPEFARTSIAGAARVANPGCYPTGVLLCLVPFLSAGVVEGPFVVDALSGISGAGRKNEDSLLFTVASGDLTAYGSVDHRHVPEMERGLELFGGGQSPVSFTPHLVPTARGLLVTARARLKVEVDDQEALSILEKSYSAEPFVHVVPSWPGSKSATGSNHAFVSARADHRTGWLIASAALDNLGKGAAGQALQNANLMLGLDEVSGLEDLGVWP